MDFNIIHIALVFPRHLHLNQEQAIYHVHPVSDNVKFKLAVRVVKDLESFSMEIKL